MSDSLRALSNYDEPLKSEIRRTKAEKVWRLGDLRFYECPVSYITAETKEIIRLVYRVHETNRLLWPGEWGDQPPWLVDAYDIYKVELARKVKQ